MTIAAQRLAAQCITRPRRGSAADVVAAFGAVQAQEYPFAKWALALRLAAKVVDADIEAELDRGDILRTHILRPTWHFVTAADIGWIQQLTAPRVHARLATYLPRLGVEKRTLPKSTAVIEKALRDRCYLTRPELMARLTRAGVKVQGTALAMVIMHAELERVICSGPRRGKLFTYALLDERAPKARPLDRDESLAELTRRFFATHGPATVRDFVWWSSLATADARRGLDIVKARRREEDGVIYWSVGSAATQRPKRPDVHLLPIYDEYLVAYRDRVAVPHGASSFAPGPLKHALLIDGQVAGLWALERSGEVRVTPTRKLSAAESKAVAAESARFRRFLGISA